MLELLRALLQRAGHGRQEVVGMRAGPSSHVLVAPSPPTHLPTLPAPQTYFHRGATFKTGYLNRDNYDEWEQCSYDGFETVSGFQMRLECSL